MSNRAHEAPIDASVIVPFAIFTLVWSSTWIVIRDQLGTVAPQWSVAYRFLIAAAGMALVARWQGHSLKPSKALLWPAAVIGLSQFSMNFNSVYLAEQFITSGVVATVFALLLIPNSLMAWAFLGQKPSARFFVAAAVATAGVGLLFLNELRTSPLTDTRGIATGLLFTFTGLMGASIANVYQAGERAKAHPLPVLLTWSMAVGALVDVVLAVAVAGPPTFDLRPGYWIGLLYLALAASVLCFSLYFPVVRKIGPGRAAYSSVIVPIIAMALSTLFENFRWSPLAAAGGALAIGGMVLALGGKRRKGAPELVASPDAA